MSKQESEVEIVEREEPRRRLRGEVDDTIDRERAARRRGHRCNSCRKLGVEVNGRHYSIGRRTQRGRPGVASGPVRCQYRARIPRSHHAC